MDGKPKRKQTWFQFLFLTLMVFTAVVGLAFTYYLYARHQAERAQAFRRTDNYVYSVLSKIQVHKAFREHPLLNQCEIQGGSGGSGGGSSQFESHSELYTSEWRANWPVAEIRKAMLSAYIEAVHDAGFLSDAKATFTLEGAVLAGKEGKITWGIKIEKTKANQQEERIRHRLGIQVTCNGDFHFEDPLLPIPTLYQFDQDAELALQSESVEDRSAGATFIWPGVNAAATAAVFAAIERETDPDVMSRLFRSLEGVSPQSSYDAGPAVATELVAYMEQKHKNAPLAARTILCSDRFWELTAKSNGGWQEPSLSYIRRASIDLLHSEQDQQFWPRAIELLAEQMTPTDHKAIDALVYALGRGGSKYQIGQILRSNEYAYNRLFDILAQSDQTEVWFSAADILANDSTFKFENGQTMWQRRNKLGNLAQRRIQLAGGWSGDLAVFGDYAIEYVSQFVGYDVQQNANRLSSTACRILVKLGDQRAVPVLAQAFEEQYQQGMFDDEGTAFYGIHLTKAINELTGENIGGLGTGPGAGGDEAENTDWPAIRKTLSEKFGTTIPSESAIKEATSSPMQ